jgi:hypothetical protein
MRNVQALDSDYELDVNLTRVNKSELLFVDNPHYESLARRFQHLKEAKLNDNDISHPHGTWQWRICTY